MNTTILRNLGCSRVVALSHRFRGSLYYRFVGEAQDLCTYPGWTYPHQDKFSFRRNEKPKIKTKTKTKQNDRERERVERKNETHLVVVFAKNVKEKMNSKIHKGKMTLFSFCLIFYKDISSIYIVKSSQFESYFRFHLIYDGGDMSKW